MTLFAAIQLNDYCYRGPILWMHCGCSNTKQLGTNWVALVDFSPHYQLDFVAQSLFPTSILIKYHNDLLCDLGISLLDKILCLFPFKSPLVLNTSPYFRDVIFFLTIFLSEHLFVSSYPNCLECNSYRGSICV